MSKPAKEYFIESCITTVTGAMHAQEKGADRIEICSHLEDDGLTPDYHVVEKLCQKISIPVRVIIRATPAGFEADKHMLNEMAISIRAFKHLPIDGFVTGILKNNKVDKEGMKSLTDAAYPFPITFHKAIDQSIDLLGDVDWMNDHPVIDTILTSGGAVRVIQGFEMILKVKSVFDRNIMAGGKIIPEDLAFTTRNYN